MEAPRLVRQRKRQQKIVQDFDLTILHLIELIITLSPRYSMSSASRQVDLLTEVRDGLLEVKR